ncbi:MAG: C4-dicarboxylate ABC transporter [Rhodospirillaceae bacterium]|nr:C4-dicarboxylate ABC transporter [Rhodospirillaceae bacterium]
MRFLGLVIALVVGVALGVFFGPRLIGSDSGTQVAGTPASETGTAPAASAENAVRWRMASTYASQTPILGPAGVRVGEVVSEITNGEVQIKFFEPGALVPALEAFDAVSAGSVEASWATPGFWAGKVPALQLMASVPFGPGGPEYMAWMYYGGGKEIYEELYARYNIKGIMCGLFPPEASGWFRNEIKTLDDLKGLKMRFFALGAKVMEKLGVSTQLLAGGDIYPALELGTIDATEYSSPALDRNFGFDQIAKHYYFPGWHQQSTWIDMMINMDAWNTLTPAHQKAIEVACGDSIRNTIAEGEYRQGPALEYLQGQGVQLHKWGPEFLDAFRGAWEEVVEEEAAKDADFKRAWESLKSFRETYKVWRELGYL